jgi:hypothetical protein
VPETLFKPNKNPNSLIGVMICGEAEDLACD